MWSKYYNLSLVSFPAIQKTMFIIKFNDSMSNIFRREIYLKYIYKLFIIVNFYCFEK
jgi:hypothetical protein